MKDYDALFSTTLSTAAKLIAPDSLANDSVRELEFVSEKDRQIAQDAADLVQPGDIIFVTTPGRFYAFWRRITNNLHDHAVVVIDKETVLHVGPPRARKLQLQRLLLPKRQPAILRPNLTPEQRECFVDSMKQLEHCTYDIIRAYRLIVRLALDHLYSIKPLRPLKPCDWKYRSWICSDAILYLLADSNPEMMKMIKESASKLGKNRNRSIETRLKFAQILSSTEVPHFPILKRCAFSTRPSGLVYHYPLYHTPLRLLKRHFGAL